MTTTEKHFFVIVNYNGGDHIIATLRSILSSHTITPHIIVVDNHSTDTSLQQCKNLFPHTTYIAHTENTGFAHGANTGIRTACAHGATTITLVNPDALLDTHCMERIIARSTSTGPGIFSPVIFTHRTKDTVWFSGGIIDFVRMRGVHKTPKNTEKPLQKHAFISGCVMMISREVINTIGLFDERFFLYYEDVDFSYRAQAQHFPLIIVADAHAYHKEISEKTPDKKIYHLVYSGILFFLKHGSLLQKMYFRTHIALRRIKNYCDRKTHKPHADSVHDALIAAKKHL